jgi:L-rhamnose mutarotase
MGKIVGLRTRLKPGMEESYDKAHAEVWPELVRAQLDLGIEHWQIFRHGVELFHVVECDDFDRATATLSAQPIDQQWQREMSRYVVVSDLGTGAAVDRLHLVYRR